MGDLRSQARALQEFLEEPGYHLTDRQLDAIMTGDVVPDEPGDFIELVSRYFQIDAAEQRILVMQVAFDIIRDALGVDAVPIVFDLPREERESDHERATMRRGG